ncbi:MAG: alkaline phosphatase family protein, partial [Muribaculaceae bacterium]|nr:alkaline phosphatase family protein [Muribaculaceae bacterium]
MSFRRLCIVVAVMVSALAGTMDVAAQKSQNTRPSLVVGIVVDGMQQRYIDLLMPYFGQDGFRRLLQRGLVMEHVDYGTAVDPTAAAAMLYTGAPAAVSGIPSAQVYDRVRNMPYSVFLDPEKIGNFTDETYSPKALQVSTLSDEIRMDNGGLGNVHAIAPDASMAIIMAGHAGNSAFWISDVDGRWATT